MPLPATDANGIITEGKFAGLKADEVFAFAEAAVEAGAPPPKPATPTNPTPADALATAAAERITPMQNFTFAQFEQIDEENFRRTVTDYDKYKLEIDKHKAKMTQAQRAQQGLHKFLYANVKMNDPELQEKIFGTKASAPVADPPPPADPAAPPVPDPAAPPAPVATAPTVPVVPPTPKPVPPPAAPPTPRNAPPPTNSRVPKLKGTHKTLALADRWRMKHDDYLLMLEDQGTTQEELDLLSTPSAQRQTSNIRSIYDRT